MKFVNGFPLLGETQVFFAPEFSYRSSFCLNAVPGEMSVYRKLDLAQYHRFVYLAKASGACFAVGCRKDLDSAAF